MKKLLALVLALVMTLSLCTVTNAAYPDDAAIDYDEAVAVMSALGVFQGDEKGNFNPDAVLTRETAAKILTYMLLGKKNADTLVTIAAPYADVEATRWSAGSIAYCTNEGILAGKGDGTFGPTEPLTGLAFAKMLLVALGYDAEVEGFVGNTWSINVAKLALQAGLTKGLDDVALSSALTREQACQMAFNTELATMVKYENSSTITAGDVTIKTNTKAEDVTNTKAAGYKTVVSDNDELMQFCEQYAKKLKLDVAADSDDFERPASTWLYDSDKVATVADDATYALEGKVTGKTMYNTVGKTVAKDYTWTVYVDGAAGGFAKTDVKSTNTDGLTGCVAGSTTEVYVDTENKDVTVCIINTYVAKVATVKAAKGDDAAYITLTNVGEAAPTYTNKYETESFKKDDVVLFTVAKNEIQSVELAEKVEGTLSQVKVNTNFVCDGKTYSYSAKMLAGDKLTTFDKDAKNDMLFYVDTQGNCIYIGEVETETNYAYVLGVDSKSSFGETTYLAKLVFADATVADVEVDAAATAGKVVTYKVDDNDVYTLTDATTLGGTSAAEAVVMKNGVSKFTVDGTAAYADDDTVVIVEKVDGSKKTYKAYAGVNEMPGLSATDGAAAEDAGLAKFVFVTNATMESDTTKVAAFIYGLASDAKLIKNASGNYYEAKAIVDGEEETLLVAEESGSAPAATNLKAVDGVVIVSKLTTNSKGLVTDYTVKAADADNVAISGTGDVKSLSKSVVSLDGDRYTVAADATVIIVEDGEMSIGNAVPTAEGATFNGFVTKGKLSTLVVYLAD